MSEKSSRSKDTNQTSLIQQLLQQKDTRPSSQLSSPYHRQYLQYFSGLKDIRKKHYIKQLSHHKIRFSEQPFTNNVCFQILSKSLNSAVVQLLVTFPHFIFQISIFNLEEESMSHLQLKFLNSGSNGALYLCRQQVGKQFAVKIRKYKFDIKPQKNDKVNQNILYEAIEEYCFCKLFSVLRIGPYVSDYFGFDLLIFDSTIEFAMEVCKGQNEIDVKQLKQNLKIMHSFKIIHGDIKPQNIMWSPKYHKLVFIDFGFSRNLQQQVNQLTWTPYFGTINYSIPEMIECFKSNKNQLVDLYFNDVFALKKSVLKIDAETSTWIQRSSLQYIKNKQFRNSKKFNNFLFNLKLKKLIFEKQFELIKSFCSSNNQLLMPKQCLYFFAELKPTKQTVKILRYLIDKYQLKGQDDVNLMLEFHKRKILHLSTHKNQNNFEHRITQKRVNIKTKNQNNEIINFIRLCYLQDFSQNAKTEKEENMKKLIQAENDKDYKKFFHLMVAVIKNMYTSKEQVLQILELSGNILKMNKVENCQKQYEISTKSIEIKNMVQVKYGIDLTNIYRQLEQQSKKKIKQNFTIQQKMLNHLIQSSKQVIKQLTGNQKENNSFRTHYLAEMIKKIKGIIPNRDFLAELVIQQIKINVQKFPLKILQLRYQLFQKLVKFQIAAKSKLATYAFYSELRFCYEEFEFSQVKNIYFKIQQICYNSCFLKKIFCDNYFEINIIHKILDEKNHPQFLNSFTKNLQSYFKLLNNHCLNKNLFRLAFFTNYMSFHESDCVRKKILQLVVQTYEREQEKITSVQLQCSCDFLNYCYAQLQQRQKKQHMVANKQHIKIIFAMLQRRKKQLLQNHQTQKWQILKFYESEINLKIKLCQHDAQTYAQSIINKLELSKRVQNQFGSRIIAGFLLRSMVNAKFQKKSIPPHLEIYTEVLYSYFCYELDNNLLQDRSISNYIEVLFSYYLKKEHKFYIIYEILTKINQYIRQAPPDSSSITIISMYKLVHLVMAGTNQKQLLGRAKNLINFIKHQYYENRKQIQKSCLKIIVISQMVFNFLAKNTKVRQKSAQIIFLLKISSQLFSGSNNSFIFDHFRSVACFIGFNLIIENVTYGGCSKYKKRYSMIKCLRSCQYEIGINNTNYLLKQLQNKKQKYGFNKNYIAAYQAIKSKINKINWNLSLYPVSKCKCFFCHGLMPIFLILITGLFIPFSVLYLIDLIEMQQK